MSSPSHAPFLRELGATAEPHKHSTWDGGLPPVVNAIGTMTSLGGSRMRPRAVAAMSRISGRFVDLNELYVQAGKRICELAKAPEGYDAHVVTGAAAGLALCVVSCIAADGGRGDLLPFKQELHASVIRKRYVLTDAASDTRWDSSLALPGTTVVRLGTAESPMSVDLLERELAAVGGEVAAVVLFYKGVPDSRRPARFEDVIRACHSCRSGPVPVIIDAAACLPPVENLWKFTTMGADAVLFSGGKAIGGPQSAGILLGRSHLIRSARANSSPNEGPLMRVAKVSKEATCGLVEALEEFVEEDQDALSSHYSTVLETIRALVQTSAPGLCGMSVMCPGPPDIQPNHIPRLTIDVTPGPALARSGTGTSRTAGFTAASVDHGRPLAVKPVDAATSLAHALANRRPPIAVNTTVRGIMINPQTLTSDEASYVGRAVADELQRLSAKGVLSPLPQSKL